MMKMFLLGAIIKSKIELLLKVLSFHLQLKFFAIALAGLVINLARFWIDVKKAPSKVRQTLAPSITHPLYLYPVTNHCFTLSNISPLNQPKTKLKGGVHWTCSTSGDYDSNVFLCFRCVKTCNGQWFSNAFFSNSTTTKTNMKTGVAAHGNVNHLKYRSIHKKTLPTAWHTAARSIHSKFNSQTFMSQSSPFRC